MSSNKRIIFLSITGAMVVLVLIIWQWPRTQQATNQDSTGGASTTQIALTQTGISNYDQTVSDLPDERRSAIDQTLQNMLALNNSELKTAPEAVIRDDKTVIDTYDAATDVHYGSFMVDLPTLHQSYFIQFEWSVNPANINLSGYSVVIECPTADQLHWADFDCKNLPVFDFSGDGQ